MRFGIFKEPVTTIYECPAETKTTEKGVVSAIADEGLYGTVCRVVQPQGYWIRIITHYGYAGYVDSGSICFVTEEEAKDYLASDLAVINTVAADVTTLPVVQGVRLVQLSGGSVVRVLERDQEKEGWTKVCLADGSEGYLRSQFLSPKRFGEEFLWQKPEDVLARLEVISARKRDTLGGQDGFSLQKVLDTWYDGSETAFREQLAYEAVQYMGIQYRWGGKSFAGIDCSGLVSMAYMRSGILIYRDAAIAEGYPMKKLAVLANDPVGTEESEQKAGSLECISSGETITTGMGEIRLSSLKKGDALYFPGHIAMYLGWGKYIHSTGKVGSGGVVINSLIAKDPDYRQDLVDSLYAVAGVRIE